MGKIFHNEILLKRDLKTIILNLKEAYYKLLSLILIVKKLINTFIFK